MKANDDDFWDEDPGIVALQGGPAASGGSDELSSLVLELLCAVTKLQILLIEADEDDFKVVAPRLGALVQSVARLSMTPKPRRRVGFKVPVPKKPKRKGRGRR